MSGVATLGGATVTASFAPGAYVVKQYTIVNATGGVSGTFGSVVNTNLASGFSTSLSYDANNAYLNLALGYTPPDLNDLNPNQTAVANALTNFFDLTGGIPAAFARLTPTGLSQASGEPATGAQTATYNAMTQFMNILAAPMPGGRGVPIGASSTGFAPPSGLGMAGEGATRRPVLTTDPDAWRWSVWSSAFGATQSIGANADAGTAAAANRVYGNAAGADYRLSPSIVAGFALAGGATRSSTRELGSSTSDLFQAGLFLHQSIGQGYLSAAVAYGWQDVTTDRSAGGEELQGRFDVNSWSGKLEAGHRFDLSPAALTPHASAQFTSVSLPDYTETGLSGSSLFALSHAARDVSATRSEVGVRADASFGLAGLPLTLRGSLAWVHNFETEAFAIASFQSLPGATFLVSGAGLDSNALRTTATAEYDLKNGLSVAATFDGEFGENSRSFGGKGTIRLNW